MRAKDSERLGPFRMITAAIKQREVDERITHRRRAGAVGLEKMIKMRKESVAQFQSGGREDLVAREKRNRAPADLPAAQLSESRLDG
jgi:uncharacterized protein YqeY